jgi:hypothetical protein
MTTLDPIEVGEALPLGGTTDRDLTGATVVARISVNGATAEEIPGTLDAAVNGEVRGFEVPIPGTKFTAPGYASGDVVITKTGEVWSPKKEPFYVNINAAV